ncbi:MAG: hypothetical protein EKK40_07065 [Bradyrhizobiaceae bacterium]|nr:MAG: hypothetical protein EKK40_07065 [Bradyrhizobiaceae bacterium]
MVNLTASTALDSSYNDKTVKLNAAAGLTVTLPAATGSGFKVKIVVGTTVTSNGYIIQVANSTDAYQGFSLIVSDDTAAVKGFIASAGSDDTVTLNGTTTGGYVGDVVEIEDIESGKFQVSVTGKATGTEATPFSAAV